MTTDDFRSAIGDLCDAEIVTLIRMLDEGDDVLACDRLRKVLRERASELEGTQCC